ncbi:MAG: hypothetical protein IPN69_03385 [Acidobacteria bacterium]|nr:hypothetical protein [Acidobacteriota bacterium]
MNFVPTITKERRTSISPLFSCQIPRIPESGFQRFRIPDSRDSGLGIPNRVSIASSRYHLR